MRPQGIKRVWGGLEGLMGRLSIDRQGSLRRVAARVETAGVPLTLLDRPQLDHRVLRLRNAFRKKGMTHALCIHAFALIREMAGRILNKRHYPEQLMGGWILLKGELAEMETGEGKTLTATLAAATAALAGIPVHVLTVNEYLVARDAEGLRPLYEALGLKVSFVTQEMTPPQCRAAYACDVTYVTNKQVAFDYLRDRLACGLRRGRLRRQLASVGDPGGNSAPLLRGLCFAIIDEADSVLIDEARTPLILTRTLQHGVDADTYDHALTLARELIAGCDFLLDKGRQSVCLSRGGQERLAGMDLPGSPIWHHPRRREELILQALHALHFLHKDRDYLVRDGEIVMIDVNTGRTMPDRSWERGLHQLVERKENCPLTPPREQLGRLTYQRFFRRYMRIGGMSGTASEVGAELWAVYGLRVRRIPLHRPSRRRTLPARVYPYAHEKWAAVTRRIVELRRQGRAVLVGTASVADSERLSQLLGAAGIDHRVLNARQDEAEAEIVARAGGMGRVTVATNMAGRGTDIPLGPGVARRGGLHVIAACCNPAKRVDRQLAGRCARQGDPGSHETILSLEDDLLVQHCPPRLLRILRWYAAKGGLVQSCLGRLLFRGVQCRIEGRHCAARRSLLRHEQQVGRMLAFSGPME
jgi:preprotein translocase subunit SecA